MLGAIVAAIIGAVAGTAGLILVERRKTRREALLHSRNQLARHVADIADHLGGMIDAFKHGDIPHTDGRAFVGLMHGFRDMFDASLSEGIKKRLGVLDGLVYEFGILDALLANAQSISEIPEEKRLDLQRWILVAEKLRGDLYAESRRLDTMHSP